MFNFLSERFEKIFSKLRKKTKLTETDLKEALKEVKFLLLESDVSLKVIKAFLKEVEEKIQQEKLLEKLNIDKELLLIFQNEITKILGKSEQQLTFKTFPKTIMLIGLQGSGKTTTAAKMALFFRNKKITKKPLLVSLDTHRAAAIEQLKVLAKQIGVDFFELPNSQDPLKIAAEAKKFAKQQSHDLIIYDTSGRQTNSQELMDELIKLKEILEPEKIIQIVDAMSGQEIVKTVESFHNLLGLSGFAITKLDSDAKGGAVMSISYITQLPIFFIGEGEKISNLSYFYPSRAAKRILNLGDLESIIDQAKQKIDKNKVEDLGTKMMRGTFDLDDLLEILNQINKLGKISKVIKMLPGVKHKIDSSQLDLGEKRMEYFKVLISSMTKKERANPKLLKNQTRKNRIIKGSGRTAQEFNKLLSSFEETKQRMKNFNPKNSLKFGL